MGERINIYFEDGTDYAVCLYSHWSGQDVDKILAPAVRVANDRWDDSSYATRIIISQFLKDYIDETTGYGISAVKMGDYHDLGLGYRIINFKNQKISFQNESVWTFSEYVNAFSSK